MNFTAGLIPVTQKASNVCAYCRVRKQRCDRTLPRCERCAIKGRDCDYTPYKDPPCHESLESEPLVVQHEACSHVDLTPNGAMDLLRVVSACVDEPQDSASSTRLSDLVYEILDLAEFDLAVALGEFGPCIQQWCPTLLEEMLLACEDIRGGGPKNSLLWLCLWLVMRRTCQNQDHITRSELYRTIKQIISVSQSTLGLDLMVLQLGMLVTVYEVGHGMHVQAFQTLATSVALLRVLELDSQGKETRLMETMRWMKASVLMLDRMIPISMISRTLPLTILFRDAIGKSVAETLGPTIPPHPPRPCASSPRKVHIRATVSLASGQALEYIHARRYSSEPERSYDDVDEIISECIKFLVDKPEPHTWLHCDAIAMAFCSHVILQTAQMKHLCSILQHPHTLHAPAPEYIKAHLALKYSRRMSWDMVKVAIRKILSESEIAHLPFAGLCCVLRAGLAVLETTEFVDEDVVNEVEVQGFKEILSWFSGRWSIGKDYLSRMEELSLMT